MKGVYAYVMFQLLCAEMEKYVWLEGLPQQDEWKYVMIICGAQYVMTCGMFMMPE